MENEAGMGVAMGCSFLVFFCTFIFLVRRAEGILEIIFVFFVACFSAVMVPAVNLIFFRKGEVSGALTVSVTLLWLGWIYYMSFIRKPADERLVKEKPVSDEFDAFLPVYGDFCYPRWDKVGAYIDERYKGEVAREAWNEVSRAWVHRISASLGCVIP